MSKPAKPKVLIIEDNLQDSLIYKKCLNQNFEVEILETGEEALAVVSSFKPDAVVLDIKLPGLSGYEICKALRTRPLKDYIGVVMITANEDQESHEKSLLIGADAFGTKAQLIFQINALLHSALRIKETMRELNDVNQRLKQANERLKKLSLTDELTGLYNMRFVARQVRNEFRRAERYHKNLSVIILDIDDFRRINGAFDHLTGSFVITQVAKIISDSIRLNIDYAARYGGDEYIIVLPETDFEGSYNLAMRLHDWIVNHNFNNGIHSLQVTASIGLASYDGALKNMASIEELM
ncbi:MAG: diguanylate cyclase, partial [Proteobacteria bacterium]|nr:diguanylate cyclase [Pseudomonadota bacterium]